MRPANLALESLCDQFLRQSLAFAGEFVRVAGLSGVVASEVEGRIVTRCGEAIAEAQVSISDKTLR
jgi:hypothetical protein